MRHSGSGGGNGRSTRSDHTGINRSLPNYAHGAPASSSTPCTSPKARTRPSTTPAPTGGAPTAPGRGCRSTSAKAAHSARSYSRHAGTAGYPDNNTIAICDYATTWITVADKRRNTTGHTLDTPVTGRCVRVTVTAGSALIYEFEIRPPDPTPPPAPQHSTVTTYDDADRLTAGSTGTTHTYNTD